MKEERDINVLILMLSLKVSKQTQGEASKNKEKCERVSNVSIN